MDDKISEADKIKLKFEAIWKARDNELNAVRERTLLVWGFLMFCYGGYGYLAHELLNSCRISDARFSAYNLALLFLSIVCFRLSLYWVEIAKGAKAWAENMDFIAEGFLHLFTRNDSSYVRCPFSTKNGRNNSNIPNGVFTNKNCKSCKGDPSYACVFSVIDPKSRYYCDVDANVLTTKGGAFSPSAVVVSISRLSMFISMALCFIHGSLLVVGKVGVRAYLARDGKGLDEWFFPAALAMVFLIVPFVVFVLRNLITLIQKVRVDRTNDVAHNQKKSWAFKLLIDSIMHSGNVSMGLQDNQTIRNSFKVVASK